MGRKLKVNKGGDDEVEKDKDGQPCVPDSTLKLHLASEFQTKSDYAHKEDVGKLAKKQVKWARRLLNEPNATSIEILKEAAGQLRKLLQQDNIKKETKYTIQFNRSVYGGIKNAAGVTNDNAKISLDQISWVQNVEANNSDATGVDRAGVLALLGDIGTGVMDCNPNKEGKLNEAYCKIKTTIHDFFKPMKRGAFDIKVKAALGERGGSAIAPRKKKDEKGCGMNKERGMVKEGGKLKLATRSGLLNDGTGLENNPFKANWPWQTLPEEYFSCAEPWAGHYSGSILEVLFMLDTTTKTKFGKNDPFATFFKQEEPQRMELKFNSEVQRCKAALAGAFLISIGYHSAIEVKPTIWKFLGKPMPKIFSRKSPPENCDANATKDIVALFKECTKKKDQ